MNVRRDTQERMKLLEQENEMLNKEQAELLKEIERLRDDGKKMQRMLLQIVGYNLTVIQIPQLSQKLKEIKYY